MIIEGNKLTAEPGMVLTNGEIFTDSVFLGIRDSVDNWHEIPESEAPDTSEATADDFAEALAELGVRL